MLELQADFFAGVWAHHAQQMKNILDRGDIDEALNAANAIGDDRLQKETRGYVVPESFTHGTSQQRMYWFKKGFDTGDMGYYDDLYKTLTGKAPNPVPAEDGIKTIKIIEAALQSAKEGKIIHLNY